MIPGVYGLLTAVATLLNAAATLNADAIAKPRPFHLESVRNSVKAERVNGMTLRAFEASLDEAAGEQPRRIKVEWGLNYDGPRNPAFILTPSLTNPTTFQTQLYFFAQGKSGKTYGWGVSSPPGWLFGGSPPTPREWFLRIKAFGNGKGGTLTVPLSDVKNRLLTNQPDEFDGDTPPKTVFVRIHHEPTDRGERLHLDAWTGQLMSNTIPLDIPNW